MAADLIVAPEAEHDLTEGYLWYEGQRPGLGEDFLTSGDAVVQAVRRNPEMYAIFHEAYRRGLVRRFPYAVFYEYADGAVTIFGVFHTSLDPEKWRRRLP